MLPGRGPLRIAAATTVHFVLSSDTSIVWSTSLCNSTRECRFDVNDIRTSRSSWGHDAVVKCVRYFPVPPPVAIRLVSSQWVTLRLHCVRDECISINHQKPDLSSIHGPGQKSILDHLGGWRGHRPRLPAELSYRSRVAHRNGVGSSLTGRRWPY